MMLFLIGLLIGGAIGFVASPHLFDAVENVGIEADDFGPPSP